MNDSDKRTNGSKNIVICSDGTGNTAIKGRGTNVFKIFEAVDIYGHATNPSLTRQVAIYDDGVGTSIVKPLKLLGGAFGWGLSRNVKELYTELARVYEPGDRIYLFGFSRGAFTVRTLAGLIVTCGIIDRTKCQDDLCLTKGSEAAYNEYRQRYRTLQGQYLRKPVDLQGAENFRKQHAVTHETHAREGKIEIEFIGVWDTVDAVGIPFAGLGTLINNFIYRYKFPDQKLSPQVRKACHALAIDDERETFHPEMWDEEGEEDGRIEQVWFSGVHSNVGGGYPKQGMSLVTLYWMMRKAEAAGLRFSDYDWCFVRDHQNPFDKVYDSRAGFAVYYRYKPRDMEAICRRHHVTPKIHVSAMERIVQGSGGYSPGNIAARATIEVTDPHFSDIKGIPPIIAMELQPDGILLDLARGWLKVRRICYFVFIVLSVVTLFLLLMRSFDGREGIVKGVMELFSGSLLTKLYNAAKGLAFNVQIIIVLSAAALLAVTLFARKKMKATFSALWYKLYPELLIKLT